MDLFFTKCSVNRLLIDKYKMFAGSSVIRIYQQVFVS